MTSRNKLTINSVVVAFFLVQLSIIYKNSTAIMQHFSGNGSGFRYNLLSFVMPLVVGCMILLVCQRKKTNGFFFICFALYIYAILISLATNAYSITGIVFPALNMVYWVAVMYISYEYWSNQYQLYEFFDYEKKKNRYIKGYFIFLVILFILFLQSYNHAVLLTYYQNRDLLMNSVYYILFLLPIVLCSEKKWINILAFAIVMVSAIFSDKRTALIMVVLCWVIWVFLSLRDDSVSKKLLYIVGAIILTAIGYNIFLKLTSNYNINILDRLGAFFSGEDNGSGRGEIWESTFKVIKDEGLLNMILGRGYRAVSVNQTYSALSEAHNDFLQVLFDYGIIGLAMLISICVKLIKMGIRMYKCHYEYANAFIISLFIFFSGAMMSMVIIYPYWFIAMTSFWGFAIADFNRYLSIEGDVT